MALALFTKNAEGGCKRSLILAGGGVRVAYQAGVVQALEEAGLQFDHVDGTSGGIFNTAMLASGISPDEIAERWRKLKLRHFMAMNPLREYFRPRRLMSFGSADGIRKKVFPQLGIDLEKIRSNRDFTATFNVCNFSDKTIEAITNEQVTEDHLIAGVSLPIFMPAVLIGDDWYSDAVWIKDANMLEAVKRGSEEIWLVWIIGNFEKYLTGALNQYVHMIEMSANSSLAEEHAEIERLNERIRRGDSPYGQTKPIKVHIIKPEFPLPLDPDLFLNKINTTTLINMGYEDARKYLSGVPENGINHSLTATRMKPHAGTLSFRGVFSGKLKFKNESTNVSYDLSLEIRKTDGGFSLCPYSSIYIQALGKQVSTAKNKADLQRLGKKQVLKISSEFVNAGRIYFLEAMITLNSAIDWFLGLEFKKVNLIVRDAESGDILLEGYLTQNIKNRLGSFVNSSLQDFSQPKNKLWLKYKLLANFYRTG
jgi:predicted patatin/cPLA2 family phospholipase